MSEGGSTAIIITNAKAVKIGSPKNPLPDNIKLPVSEIFATIQGEGLYLGLPSIFIRFYGCNLACPTCDAWYTVPRLLEKKGIKPEFAMMTMKEILKKVMRLSEKYPAIGHIVISGGEPLMYQKQLHPLINILAEREDTSGYGQIEWETNGTISPDSVTDSFTTSYDVSPKLATFGGLPESERIVTKPLNDLVANPKAMFKFVIGSKEDIKELRTLQDTYRIPTSRIYLMPMGETNEEIKETGLIAAEACMRYGYSLTWRLQTPLWGTRRGT